MKYFGFAFLAYLISFSGYSQVENRPLKGDPFINTVEQSLLYHYSEYSKKAIGNYDSIIDALNYDDGQVISFTDEEYCARLNEMNKLTPFHLDCNESTLSTIRFFAEKRRGFTRVVLGRSRLYFDLFEQKLTEHNLPIELKYLAVIESGLRPQVKSRAGALGLWQFMYGTGKMFGLTENSYIDERMDPVKATDAACRYLKQLCGIYGDWNLALAAYNAGPGNVNKAIRRSGNKTTYWEVRPFLPKETQGYVPNFIAAAYMMTYHAEHNIIPAEAEYHFVEMDTMCLSKAVHMTTISKLVDWTEPQIKELNPIFKRSYIPETSPKQCIQGPLKTIGQLVSLEDSLYRLEDAIYNPTPDNQVPNESVTQEGSDDDDDDEPVTNTTGTVYHKVRSGETLGIIASKYGTTVNKIMTLNGLRSTNIYVGQRLKIQSSGATTTNTTPAPTEAKKYYSVRKGDTFGIIAQRHGKSVNQLRKLNPGINISRLQIGQKIRVK